LNSASKIHLQQVINWRKSLSVTFINLQTSH